MLCGIAELLRPTAEVEHAGTLRVTRAWLGVLRRALHGAGASASHKGSLHMGSPRRQARRGGRERQGLPDMIGENHTALLCKRSGTAHTPNPHDARPDQRRGPLPTPSLVPNTPPAASASPSPQRPPPNTTTNVPRHRASAPRQRRPRTTTTKRTATSGQADKAQLGRKTPRRRRGGGGTSPHPPNDRGAGEDQSEFPSPRPRAAGTRRGGQKGTCGPNLKNKTF